MAKLNRRNFLATMSSSVLGLSLFKNLKARPTEMDSLQSGAGSLKIQKYNPLGNTGLKVSDVSCGAISFFNPNVLRYAYDCGVNYFDTAENYMRTRSESFLGQALKDVRDKVIITTKHAMGGQQKIEKNAIIKRIENSLKRLNTDYIDIAMVHSVEDLKLLENEELQAAYTQLKKEGKIRFTGFSTHDAKQTLKQAISNDFAQVILVIYSHMQGKEYEPLIKEVRQKGKGIVAMKIFAGGMQGELKSLVSEETSYPQAAIRWVLKNPSIDCCIPTFSSYSHVEEYVTASGKPLQTADLRVISSYQRQANNQYCRVGCEECLSACPRNVAINDVMRYGMYFSSYRIEREAMRYYAELEDYKKPLHCSDCSGVCESACPYGIKVKDRLILAHQNLVG